MRPLFPHPFRLPHLLSWTTNSCFFYRNADRALGRLDGVTTILPNPDLFVAMYVKQEAVFSSQIEGTQSTLEECAGI